MKSILIILAAGLLAGNLHAQLLPLSPAEIQLGKVATAANSATYYHELAAQSLARLHAEIFVADDEVLTAMLIRLGQQDSTVLLEKYFAAAQAINAVLAGAGSSVRAPDSATRDWTWVDGQPVVVPLPEAEPTPAE